MTGVRLCGAILVSWVLSVGAVLALDVPQNNVLLTVTGHPGPTNSADLAQFDRDMLERLDWREIETFTPTTDGPQRFAGPTLTSLMRILGVTEGVLHATAVNDYTVEIPVAHAEQFGVILAMDHNDRPMRVRDKGPIWVIYPMSQIQAARKHFDAEMIWQLVSIRVVN